MSMKISDVKQAVIRLIQLQLVPMIVGSPGVGKSGIVHEIAKEFNLAVIDLRLSQCDPTDLSGFPNIIDTKDKNGKVIDRRSAYLPMAHFPLEGDALPLDDKGSERGGWLLFLDEMNSAAPAVQAAAYKLVLDRMVGDKRLHDNVAIVAAGNRETDGAIVESMSTALQSRMVHLDLSVDNNDWVKWALTHDVDPRILGYLNFKPNDLYTFKPDHSDKTYACPRTWEFANRLIQQPTFDPNDNLSISLLSGTLGLGVALPFITFCKIKTHSIQDILKDPENISIPREISVIFTLIGSIAQHMTKDNVGDLMKFIQRLPGEYTHVCMREAIYRDNTLMHTPEIALWAGANADKLL